MRRALVPLLIPLALLAVFHPLLTDHGLADRDLVYHYYPLARLRAALIQSGELLPGWNPLVNGGTPYAANPLNGVFYPPTLLYGLLPDVPVAFAWVVLLHRMGLGLLGFWMARQLGLGRLAALVSGWVLCLGGLTLTTDALQFLFAYTWIPLYVGMLARQRRRRGLAPLAGALGALTLILLAGEPQTFYVMVAVTPLLWWGLAPPEPHRPEGEATAWARQITAGAGAAGLLAVAAMGLAAVSMLPLSELSALGNRPLVNTYGEATVWSFHPIRTLELFVDLPFGLPDPGRWTFWAFPLIRSPFAGFYAKTHHVGAIAFLLGVGWLAWSGRATRRIGWTLSAIALLALLLSFGDWLGLYRILYVLLPRWSLFRFPERLLVHLLWPLALLAGIAIDGIRASAPGARRLGIAALAGGLLCLLASLLAPVEQIAATSVPEEAAAAAVLVRSTLIEGLRRAALIFGAFGGVVLPLGWRVRAHRWAGPIAAAAVVVDLLASNGSLPRFLENEMLRQRPQVLTAILDDWAARHPEGPARPPRIYSRVEEFERVHGVHEQRANWQLAGWNIPAGWGVATVSGYDSLELMRAVDFIRSTPFDTMCAVLGVDYVVSVPSDKVVARFPRIYAHPRLPIVARRIRPARAPIETLTAWRTAETYEEALWILSDLGFDPREETVLVRTPDSFRRRAQSPLAGFEPGPAAVEEGASEGRAPKGPEPATASRDATWTPGGGAPTGDRASPPFRLDRATRRITASQTTAVVLGEMAYPGWRYRLDGGPPRSPLLFDGVLPGALVPPGEHEVVFEFVSTRLAAGARVSAASLVLIAAAFGLAARRRTRR